jgi:hypothetical protein
VSRIITTRSLIAASLGLSLLTGCEDMTAVGSLPINADAYATTLAEIKDDFDEAQPHRPLRRRWQTPPRLPPCNKRQNLCRC